jgi:hypothetical protein
MPAVSLHTAEAPASVLAVLADGWRYADWVVGAQRIRDVDDGWPSDGACIHHRVGVGPLSIADTTEMLAWRPPATVVLEARVMPFGRARVTLSVTPEGDGSRLTMDEVPLDGPAKIFDLPGLNQLIVLRNTESLRRLARLAATTPV